MGARCDGLCCSLRQDVGGAGRFRAGCCGGLDGVGGIAGPPGGPVRPLARRGVAGELLKSVGDALSGLGRVDLREFVQEDALDADGLRPEVSR